MLKEAIRNNWATDISGYAQIIPATKDSNYPAWTIKILNSYGVAIPYDGEDDINESFANARIYSDTIVFDDHSVKKALILSTSTEGIETTFSALCYELIEPGFNGEKRLQILASTTKPKGTDLPDVLLPLKSIADPPERRRRVRLASHTIPSGRGRRSGGGR